MAQGWCFHQPRPLVHVGAQVASPRCPILHHEQQKYTTPLFQGVKISGVWGQSPHLAMVLYHAFTYRGVMVEESGKIKYPGIEMVQIIGYTDDRNGNIA